MRMFAEKKLEKRYEKYVSLASSLVSPQSPKSSFCEGPVAVKNRIYRFGDSLS